MDDATRIQVQTFIATYADSTGTSAKDAAWSIIHRAMSLPEYEDYLPDGFTPTLSETAASMNTVVPLTPDEKAVLALSAGFRDGSVASDAVLAHFGIVVAPPPAPKAARAVAKAPPKAARIPKAPKPEIAAADEGSDDAPAKAGKGKFGGKWDSLKRTVTSSVRFADGTVVPAATWRDAFVAVIDRAVVAGTPLPAKWVGDAPARSTEVIPCGKHAEVRWFTPWLANRTNKVAKLTSAIVVTYGPRDNPTANTITFTGA